MPSTDLTGLLRIQTEWDKNPPPSEIKISRDWLVKRATEENVKQKQLTKGGYENLVEASIGLGKILMIEEILKNNK